MAQFSYAQVYAPSSACTPGAQADRFSAYTPSAHVDPFSACIPDAQFSVLSSVHNPGAQVNRLSAYTHGAQANCFPTRIPGAQLSAPLSAHNPGAQASTQADPFPAYTPSAQAVPFSVHAAAQVAPSVNAQVPNVQVPDAFTRASTQVPLSNLGPDTQISARQVAAPKITTAPPFSAQAPSTRVTGSDDPQSGPSQAQTSKQSNQHSAAFEGDLTPQSSPTPRRSTRKRAKGTAEASGQTPIKENNKKGNGGYTKSRRNRH